jgi:hypothetical protein
MSRFRIPLVLILACCLVGTSSAGIIFGRKAKGNPKDRVPELIAIVKTDGDERKRADAAEELRFYDPAAFPEIVPVLIDVLLNDKKPSVRAEAASSLGKIRPVSQSAGLALEQAVSNDTSMSVRLQARSALFGYRWAGYKSVRKEEPLIPSKEPPVVETVEQPEAEPPSRARNDEPTPRSFIRKARNVQRISPRAQPASQSRPADQPSAPPPITTIPGAKPLPVGPVNPPVKTFEPPLAPPAPVSSPAPTPSSDGPALD